MKTIKELLKYEKNRRIFIIILAVFGVILIGINNLYTGKNVEETNESNYGQLLEEKTKNIIESVAGKDTTSVMITFENTYSKADTKSAYSFEKASETKTYSKVPTPDIAGVMIVCKGITNADDLTTIKKAVSICLDIPKSKIYIIGGDSQ